MINWEPAIKEFARMHVEDGVSKEHMIDTLLVGYRKFLLEVLDKKIAELKNKDIIE